MRTLLFIILLSRVIPCFAQDSPGEATLFAIVQNNQIGYIDKEGKIVLPPIYRNGGQFSEGLAPVRLKGRYGFIDTTGYFAIEPQFDLAEPFINGLAIVYLDGRPRYIDHTGQVPFPCNYGAISPFYHNRARVKSLSGLYGYVDRQGHSVINTRYAQIGNFNRGLAITTLPSKHGLKKIGVIDTLGHTVVRPGAYMQIEDFSDGYARVETNKERQGVIDSTGKRLFLRPFDDNLYVEAKTFKNGIGTFFVKNYWGFIDIHGTILLNDSTVKTIRPFSNGRAFIERDGSGYTMIDTRMQQVGALTFDNVAENGFANGYAIVETQKGWGIIDTNAHFIVNPAYGKIGDPGIIDNYFFFSDSTSGDTTLYGIASLNGQRLTNSIFEDFDPTGFFNGLLYVTIHGQQTFLNEQGRIVWQSPAFNVAGQPLTDLNIDFMLRGNFYAYSSPEKSGEPIEGGGWSISRNIPRKFNPNQFQQDSLSIVIDTQTVDTFAGSFAGHPVYLANTTKDSCQFHAQDSRLYMKIQALDKDNNWRDIEYLPNSWCGNSYHTLTLEPGANWKFVIPNFDGEMRTNLRIQLQYITKTDPKKDRLLYSNIIEGKINPAQLWNKRPYYPQGIMDPYFD